MHAPSPLKQSFPRILGTFDERRPIGLARMTVRRISALSLVQWILELCPVLMPKAKMQIMCKYRPHFSFVIALSAI